ncbi:Choline transport protein [Fulvia fulva]|uniref:Choline transport protein n=1 Tax=Passalora fulva TaxID=5499 RepID=A0A9Q8LDY8_PASFU|nr:Choline transport protein [Fulvia fulva]KAK4630824.1 Choline transport protein [Fulvia fulva]UJO15625.1 Choline transport protein [Fulvia fulva]
MELEKDEKAQPHIDERSPGNSSLDINGLVNASGHVQEIDRSWGIWSICSLALISDNAWAAGAGSIVLALYNGGGPGVMHGLIVATFFYCFIGTSLAELSSAIPSSANVYHWASVTPGPKYGRVCSWFAGWWNCIAWIFGCASNSLFAANAVVAMWSVYHPAYVPQRWHIFMCYLEIIWIDNAIVCFGQKRIAQFANVSGVACLTLFVVCTLTVAIMPSQTGYGYASNSFVWGDFQNLTGWSSNGLVFAMGMLNGAYTVGTTDAACHLCEEIPKPRVNIPKGIAAQLLAAFSTAFIFYTAVLYGVTSLDDVFASNITSLPLAAMFQQATRSNAGTMALLVLYFFDILITIPGAWVTAGRMLWVLGRDNATPFPNFVGEVSTRWRNPFNAQIICCCAATVLGLIYIGSATAFNAFVACFSLFTTISYATAILPHLLTGRKYVKPGPFYMKGALGYVVMGIACAYIIVFNVIYMFPYTNPVTDPQLMNWTSVMFAGITSLLVIGYFWKRSRGYVGPRVVMDAKDNVMEGVIGLDKEIQARARQAR